MKVTFLLDSLGAGGTERSTAVLATRLAESGVAVRVVTLYVAAEGSEQQVRDAGVPVTVLNGPGMRRQVQQLRAFLRAERPDILHTALFAADHVGRLAAIGLPVKVVSSFVNVPRTKGYDAGVANWKRILVNLSDAVTGHLFVDRFHAVTQGVARLYSKAYRLRPARITVVERGRDAELLGIRSPDRRAAVRAALGIANDRPVVLAAGRHEPQKAHTDLVHAMSLVRDRLPAAVLLIAGRDGTSTAALRDAIRATGADGEQVRLLGHRDDVPDLLAAADVMALPSHYEGTAGIALEAMALGTPIVATRLDGMHGILVHEQNSLLNDIGDIAGMAASISRLLDDAALGERLGAAARADFGERFTLDRSAERMLALYTETAARSTTGARRPR